MHSDLGFGLLFASNITRPVLQRVVELLQPYPKGCRSYILLLIPFTDIEPRATYKHRNAHCKSRLIEQSHTDRRSEP